MHLDMLTQFHQAQVRGCWPGWGAGGGAGPVPAHMPADDPVVIRLVPPHHHQTHTRMRTHTHRSKLIWPLRPPFSPDGSYESGGGPGCLPARTSSLASRCHSGHCPDPIHVQTLTPTPPCTLFSPQMDLMSLVEGLAARQDELTRQLQAVGDAVAQDLGGGGASGRKDLATWLHLP